MKQEGSYLKMSENYFLLYGETNTYLKSLVEVLHKYLLEILSWSVTQIG
jgi:hypothetical protein